MRVFKDGTPIALARSFQLNHNDKESTVKILIQFLKNLRTQTGDRIVRDITPLR